MFSMVEQNSSETIPLVSEEGDIIISALSSSTSREVFTSLYEAPKTPSEIAEDLDISVKGVHYHLRNLEAAELISQTGIKYSEKRVKMSIYDCEKIGLIRNI